MLIAVVLLVQNKVKNQAKKDINYHYLATILHFFCSEALLGWCTMSGGKSHTQ